MRFRTAVGPSSAYVHVRLRLVAYRIWGTDVRADRGRGTGPKLGLEVHEFVLIFGSGWRPLDDPTEEPLFYDRYGTENVGRWYVAGDPPQLMLQVTHEEIRLARPRGRWTSVADLMLEPVDERRAPRFGPDRELIRAHIDDLLRRRRSSFAYCGVCRNLTPPEYKGEGGLCMACSSQWLGVMY